MAIINLIKSTASVLWRRVRSTLSELNRVLGEPDDPETHAARRDREESVFQRHDF